MRNSAMRVAIVAAALAVPMLFTGAAAQAAPQEPPQRQCGFDSGFPFGSLQPPTWTNCNDFIEGVEVGYFSNSNPGSPTRSKRICTQPGKTDLVRAIGMEGYPVTAVSAGGGICQEEIQPTMP